MRAELDQRSRDARLQLEEVERRLMAQARTPSRLDRLVYWLRRQIWQSFRSTARTTNTAVAAPRGPTPVRGGYDLDILHALGAA